jgi:hypothetical protein
MQTNVGKTLSFLQVAGLFLLFVGLIVAILFCARMAGDYDRGLFIDLGVILAGIAAQFAGIGCLILSKNC